MTDDERKILEAELCKLSTQAREVAEKFLATYDEMTENALNGVICLPDEEWRDVVGYEGLYQVSNRNRMKSLHYGVEKLHMLYPNKNGYLTVGMNKDGKKKNFIFHVLVAQAFVPNPDGKPEVNHIDGNKQNNRPENLEWATRRENMQHASKTGLLKMRSGSEHPRAILSAEEEKYVLDVHIPWDENFGTKPLAELLNVNECVIRRVLKQKRHYSRACGSLLSPEEEKYILAVHIPWDKKFGTKPLAELLNVNEWVIRRVLKRKKTRTN